MPPLDFWRRRHAAPPPAPAPRRCGEPELGEWAARPRLDAAALIRSLLAWGAALPGCRGAWFLGAAGGDWSQRDRFEDADPLPEDLERELEERAALLAPREPVRAEPAALSTDPVLAAQCHRRGIRQLHLQPLPDWAPARAWLLLGLEGGAPDPAGCGEAVADLSFLLWISRLREELAREQGRAEEERGRLTVQGLEMVRVRQQAEREVELARRHVAEAERAKNEFLSSVSHELRTPLNAIQGYTRMVLREAELSERQRLCLERVMTSSRNQLRLINNVLDYSRLEAGRMRLELEELELVQILREVAHQVEPLAHERGLQLALLLPEGLERLPSVGDRAKLEQVLVNLLGNAIKFTPKGLIRLALRLEAGTIHMDVADEGIGIPRDEQGQVFERFHRSRQSEGSRGASGTGLGLAISRHLAALMGGGITLESEPGQGATFTLSLPLFLDLETATLALQAAGSEEA